MVEAHGAGSEDDSKTVHVVSGGSCVHHLYGTAGQAKRHWPQGTLQDTASKQQASSFPSFLPPPLTFLAQLMRSSNFATTNSALLSSRPLFAGTAGAAVC